MLRLAEKEKKLRMLFAMIFEFYSQPQGIPELPFHSAVFPPALTLDDGGNASLCIRMCVSLHQQMNGC